MLVENRADGASGLTSGQLDTESSTASGAWGQVISLHASGIDAPVAVRKAGNTTIAPYANWKGDYEVGTTADGTPTSSCTGTTSCPALDWPGGNENADGQKVLPAALDTWWGSLITGKTDPSGMKYMRNRYYNPSNGQFTQQDPIGLAGGINLYGFASGDPVNFGDPFGLCKGVKEAPTAPCELIAVVLAEGDGGSAGYGAVASVIMNRAGKKGIGDEDRVMSVIMEGQDGPPAQHQFAAVGNGVYNAAMAYPTTGETKNMFGAKQFSAAATAAEGHFNGTLGDNTHGALFFFQGRLPKWALENIKRGVWETKDIESYHGGNVFFGPTKKK